MAKQTFLKKEEYEEALKEEGERFLLASASNRDLCERVAKVSAVREKVVRELFRSWEGELQLYYVGSFAREEASLYSDIDLIVSGPTSKRNEFFESITHMGVPLRARNFEDLELETMDVFSLVSLGKIKSVFSEDQDHALEEFKRRYDQFIFENQSNIFFELDQENLDRRLSYNSISNYLEPNLKYQPGGLRDLEQARVLLREFQGLSIEAKGVEQNLERFRMVLLFIRQHLHARIRTDVLVASEQLALAEEFGFESIRDFMSFVQDVCSESSFLCRWLFTIVRSGNVSEEVNSMDELFDLCIDAEARKDIRKVKKLRDYISLESVTRESFFEHPRFSEFKNLVARSEENLEDFLFEAKLFDLLLPDFSRIRNLVQHDQYHRFTVGAHTLVCIRNTYRLMRGEFQLKFFGDVVSQMNRSDWIRMIYTALFHDLGKGLKVDHSTAGEKIVEDNLPLFVQRPEIVEDVKFLVRKHLLFSKTAFRANLNEAATFKRLEEEELTPSLGRILILFTLVDIASSNPEALTEWKESLLFELYTKWSNPEKRFEAILVKEINSRLKLDMDSVLPNLDIDMLESIGKETSTQILKSFLVERDFNTGFKVFELSASKKVLVYMGRENKIGTLYSLLSYLLGLGFRLGKLNANTSEEGVLDFFVIDDDRKLETIEKLLGHYKEKEPSGDWKYPRRTLWRKMEEGQWVARIGGTHLQETLLGLCLAIFQEGLDIYRLNIYKWGRQIEVVLALTKGSTPPESWLQKSWDY